MVVADSCDDDNAWCKDDPYHVDLAQASLNQFVLNGQPVGNMYPALEQPAGDWQFSPAPGYTGDINIGAIQGAQPYWPAIAISHLPNGIHGVQYYANGAWATRHDGQRHGRRLHHRADDRGRDAGHPVRDPGHRRVRQPGQQRRGVQLRPARGLRRRLPGGATRRSATRRRRRVHVDQFAEPEPEQPGSASPAQRRARRQHAAAGERVHADLVGHQLLARRLPAPAHGHQQGGARAPAGRRASRSPTRPKP